MDKSDVEYLEHENPLHSNETADHRAAHKMERRLLLKADLTILPLISLVYLASYLDRNSIGNARVMGFQKDLHLTPKQFYNSLSIFYLGWGVAMLPSNLTARKFRPHRSLGAATVFFGLCLCLMSVIKNYASLMTLRAFLGFGEAFVQMSYIYGSLWYKRDELATRASIFAACSSISGAFGGVIAYGVQANLNGKGGRTAWSWLFLIEGVIAIAIGMLEIDLAYSRYALYNNEAERFHPSQLLAVFKDVRTYFFFFIHGTAVLGVSVVGSFLPTFIRGFGFSPLRTQLFSIIPYAFAFVTVIASGYTSDRINMKGPLIFICACVGIIGYAVLMSANSTAGQFVACCLIASACYPMAALCPVWIAVNSPSYTKRSTIFPIAEACGIVFSIMGTQIYTAPPHYFGGNGTVLGLHVLAAVCTASNSFYMRLQNKKKDQILEELERNGQMDPHIAERRTLHDLEDKHIAFRYVI
ncbi:hypothetical protein H2200_002898 [Cladophialophora chaetospira]|uniref:Major facilitator superfamily (MFS) profile domain-containing protein n=1 Tax=Cladophialophora chaetospira TaxID=386627 RepID=A0AA38XGH2_9EURO|nr:hypothetical protein H2200_002898 [Cladophialophora chaetospira]